MTMNFISHTTENPYASSTRYVGGLFGPKSRDVQLAGQGVSLVKGARNRAGALAFLEWWTQYETQRAFAERGGLTTFRQVTASESFKNSTPYNEAYSVSTEHVKNYWNTPHYDELLKISQHYLHEYLTSTEKPDARATLNAILHEWNPILAHECK